MRQVHALFIQMRISHRLFGYSHAWGGESARIESKCRIYFSGNHRPTLAVSSPLARWAVVCG